MYTPRLMFIHSFIKRFLAKNNANFSLRSIPIIHALIKYIFAHFEYISICSIKYIYEYEIMSCVCKFAVGLVIFVLGNVYLLLNNKPQ